MRASQFTATVTSVALSASMFATGASAACDASGQAVTIPPHYEISSIDAVLLREWQVQTTLWSKRYRAPRTDDAVQTGFPAHRETFRLTFKNPQQFRLDHRHPWKLGVAAVYSATGTYDQQFECIQHTLQANGADPYGSYTISYIPHNNDPAAVDFQVVVHLLKHK